MAGLTAAALNIAAATLQPKGRILIFGDSLVDGWTSFGSGPRERFAPHLQRALEERGLSMEVNSVGQAGRAAAQALHPLKAQLKSNSYDAVLILLGANDLLQGSFMRGSLPSADLVSTTLGHLHKLHETVRASGARSVALGLLHHPMVGAVPSGIEAVDSFNARLAREGGADAFIDPSKLLPAGGAQGQLWSSDRVHMQPKGYIELGRRLAPPLISALELKHHHKSNEQEYDANANVRYPAAGL
jgi:lysophospholipase L1-like esterase